MLITVNGFMNIIREKRTILARSSPMVFYTQDFKATYRFFCSLIVLKVSLTAYINLFPELGPWQLLLCISINKQVY